MRVRRAVAVGLIALLSVAAAKAPRRAPQRRTPPPPVKRVCVRPPSFVQCVAWLPDSTHVLAAGFDSTTFRLYRVNLDGSGYEPITDGPDMWPTSSPDGIHVIFQSNRGKRPRLFIMKPTGEQQEELHTQPRDPRTPAWSPDGTLIALSARTDSLQRICLMRPDGSGLRSLELGQGNDWNPAWSPDGSRLVYFSTSRDVDSVYVIPRENGRRLGVARGFYPSWAKGGSLILYTRDDTVFANVPHGGAEKPFLPGAFYAVADQRSERIAYITGKWPSSTLWVVSAKGKKPIQLMP